MTSIAPDWLPRGPVQQVLAAEDRATVAALFEAILPGRSDAPGATDADAVSYVDSILVDGVLHDTYTEIIPLLRKAGADTDPGGVLRGLLAGTLPDWPEDAMAQPRFFTMLRDHCLEGCFADPRWGGNKDAVIWRWFGYIQPPQPFTRKDGGSP